MENTGPLLFDSTSAKYHLFTRGQAVGPLTAEEIYERVERGEISLLSLIWREGWADFKRICDEEEFAVLIPQKPSPDALRALQQSLQERRKPKTKKTLRPPAAPTEPVYYLYFRKAQYGPFSAAELERVLGSNKIDSSAFLWTPGWANWRQITQVAGFGAILKPAAQTSPAERPADRSQRTEKREAPRRPLVARLFVANEKDVLIAVCRDISVGGMQVLTDRVPGPVGTSVRMNVSPADSKKVSGFVAEGRIVRTLEDGRGFAFRFTKLSTEAKKLIQKYIAE